MSNHGRDWDIVLQFTSVTSLRNGSRHTGAPDNTQRHKICLYIFHHCFIHYYSRLLAILWDNLSVNSICKESKRSRYPPNKSPQLNYNSIEGPIPDGGCTIQPDCHFPGDDYYSAAYKTL